jgi:site-specific DNA-cytosine methylase
VKIDQICFPSCGIGGLHRSPPLNLVWWRKCESMVGAALHFPLRFANPMTGLHFSMFSMLSDRARQPHAFRRKQVSSQITTRFYDTYTLDTLDGTETVSLSLGDTILLHDYTLLTIDHFEQQHNESTLDNDRLNIQVSIIGTHFNLFSRCDDLGGFLANDRREVYLTDDENLKRYSINLINRKVKLVKTNAPYPAFKSEPPYTTYVCRYIKTEKSVIALPANLSDPGRTRLDETRKRNRFLRIHTTPSPHTSGRYTFGDAFSGIGGCSAGARKAGFHISWAFDGDKDVCELYAENFIHADVFMAKADEFLVLNKDKLKVDLLHMSPPCQTWSKAHTVAGKDDDANSASLFVVKELLQFARPRIATIEQVPGILSQDNRYRLLFDGGTERRNFFNAMLRSILEMGYSFHWKLMSAEKYGVPQLRKRLILIVAWYSIPNSLSTASQDLTKSPGQPLPPFPLPSHNSPGLPSPVSLRQAFQGIHSNDSLHLIRPFPVPRYSGIDLHLPYPGTIMAGGSENCIHPCGTRPFTYREFARIQTFSDSHIFGNSLIKRHSMIPVLRD